MAHPVTLVRERSVLHPLSQVANHELCDGQLVTFRCMVQDMFDPEFYLGRCQPENSLNTAYSA